MSRVLVVGAAIAVLGTAAPDEVHAGGDAEARRAVGLYLEAHATGDGKRILEAFHPDARIVTAGPAADQVVSLSREEFAARFPGKPHPEEAQRRRRLVSLDLTGNAGAAVVELDHPDAQIVDYLSLLRIGGRWWIVHKTFERSAPRAAPPAPDAPIQVVVVFRAKPGRAAELERGLTTNRERALTEIGCRMYEVHRDTQDPDVFLLYEIWASLAALDRHRQQPYLAEWRPLRDALVLHRESRVLARVPPVLPPRRQVAR